MALSIEKEKYISQSLDRSFKTWLFGLSFVGSFAFLSLSLLDYFSTPENFREFLVYRLIAATFFLVLAFIVKKTDNPKMIIFLYFVAVIVSAITVEHMILKTGGHASLYYVGLILLGICVVGILPARFYLHCSSALIIYLIYFIPILIFDPVSAINDPLHVRVFITSNTFLVCIFSVLLLFRYFAQRRLINELNLKYELIQQKDDLERANSEAESERKHYVQLVESIDGIVWEATIDPMAFSYVSPMLRDILGYNPQAWTGGIDGWVMAIHPDDRPDAVKYCNDHALAGKDHTFEYRAITADGNVKWIRDRVKVSSSQGIPVTMHGLMVDITGGKEIEHQMLKAKEDAEIANMAKSQFLANMSHEIRTPMNGIIGMAEIGLESVINEDHRNILSTIKKEADALNDIINDILDLSKIEAGRIELEEIPFDFRILLDDLYNVFWFRCSPKGISLEASRCKHAEAPHLVLGDPTRLRQIFVNLIGNAMKFTPERGKISIGCELVSENAEHATYKFKVTDTGIGIPKDKHGLIFKSFIQADGSTTRKYGGTGLGTSIAKQLVELMGGEIGVESEPGMGSTFWFVIPLKKQVGSRKVAIERESDLKDYAICLVFDTMQSPGTLDNLLFWGCTPIQVTVYEAPAMLKKLQTENRLPDLIILDCELPETDGFAHAREMRNLLWDDTVPLMLIMRTGNRGDGQRCREAGIHAYLTKPVRRHDFFRAITQVLLGRGTSNTSAQAALVTKHSLKELCGAYTHILLVEDYPTNQKIAMVYLQSLGCDIDLAENGEQAVSAFEGKAYDLIFMDVQMPVMDGYEAALRIRQREREINAGDAHSFFQRQERVPIIAMTAHAMMGDREKCLAAGMDDYIAKPLKKAELMSLIDKWLNEKPPAAPVTEEAPREEEKTGLPLDIESAVKEFEGNRDVVSSIIREFRQDLQAQIITMQNAISAGDLETVRKEAHSIKGGAANITAADLSLAASALELAAKEGETERCKEALAKLAEERMHLEAYIASADIKLFFG